MRRSEDEESARRLSQPKLRARIPESNFNFEDFALRRHIDFSVCPPIQPNVLPPTHPTCPVGHPCLTSLAVTIADSPSLSIPAPLRDFSLLFELVPGIAIVFPHPTPIQSVSIPFALQGHDVLGVAETGSGKTLSFLLPSIAHVERDLRHDLKASSGPNSRRSLGGPSVLILAPTRELVLQIESECEKLLKGLKSSPSSPSDTAPVSVMSIVGGSSRRSREIRRLRSQSNASPSDESQSQQRRGVKYIVATPGRLLDYLQARVLHLMSVTCLVLDEADMMLDLGFRKQLEQILSQIRPDRQCLMFCSTWNVSVQQWASEAIFRNSKPVKVVIGGVRNANPRVKQTFRFVIRDQEKIEVLVSLLEDDLLQRHAKILIFCASKKRADVVMRRLRDREGYPCLSLHSDVSQATRDWTFQQFRTDEDLPLLVCTDVISRGMDVVECGCVVNFDMPFEIEKYLHRIGRTARGERKGESVTFLLPSRDQKIAGEIARVLKEAGQDIPTELAQLCD